MTGLPNVDSKEGLLTLCPTPETSRADVYRLHLALSHGSYWGGGNGGGIPLTMIQTRILNAELSYVTFSSVSRLWTSSEVAYVQCLLLFTIIYSLH